MRINSRPFFRRDEGYALDQFDPVLLYSTRVEIIPLGSMVTRRIIRARPAGRSVAADAHETRCRRRVNFRFIQIVDSLEFHGLWFCCSDCCSNGNVQPVVGPASLQRLSACLNCRQLSKRRPVGSAAFNELIEES